MGWSELSTSTITTACRPLRGRPAQAPGWARCVRSRPQAPGPAPPCPARLPINNRLLTNNQKTHPPWLAALAPGGGAARLIPPVLPFVPSRPSARPWRNHDAGYACPPLGGRPAKGRAFARIGCACGRARGLGRRRGRGPRCRATPRPAPVSDYPLMAWGACRCASPSARPARGMMLPTGTGRRRGRWRAIGSLRWPARLIARLAWMRCCGRAQLRPR